MSDITASAMSKYSKELHIENDLTETLGLLTASGEFPDCPILTYLTFERQHIDESVPLGFKDSNWQWEVYPV